MGNPLKERDTWNGMQESMEHKWSKIYDEISALQITYSNFKEPQEILSSSG